MSSIGEMLIKLFDGKQAEVYLGKVEPTKVEQPKEKERFNILESIGYTLKHSFDGLIDAVSNTVDIVTSKEKRRREEEERKKRKLETIRKIKKSMAPTGSHKRYIDRVRENQSTLLQPDHKKVTKQKWDDNVDRPDLNTGRQFLKNIKMGLIRGNARPTQITETLFRDTFRKKNFSENNITTLWGEYSNWVRQYRTNGKSRL
jgi:hypothetical protein